MAQGCEKLAKNVNLSSNLILNHVHYHNSNHYTLLGFYDYIIALTTW